jgi:NDP-sugar pyrophosphorylase family protein
MSTKTIAVLLAGGKGRRLQPFTTTIPKPLFPIGEKPILQIIIEQLIEFGITDFIISLGYLGGLIEAYFGNGKSFNCNIQYIRESEPLGTAGPISLLPDLEQDYIFMNGDILSTLNFNEAMDFHKINKSVMTVCSFNKSVRSSLGVIISDEKSNIVNYIEKPENSYNVSSGIYILNPQIKNYINKNEKLDLPELVMRLVNQNVNVKSFPIRGEWFDIGTPEDLNKALEYYEKRK